MSHGQSSNCYRQNQENLETGNSHKHQLGIYSQDIGMEFYIEKCAIVIGKAANDT